MGKAAYIAMSKRLLSFVNESIKGGLYFLVCVFVALSCTKTQKQPTNQEIYKLVDTKKAALVESISLDSIGLNRVTDIAVQDSLILLLNQYQGKVILADSELKLLESYQKPGKGPGEFDKPVSVSISENLFFISDLNLLKVEVFSKDFKHINQIALNEMPWDIQAINDTSLVIAFASSEFFSLHHFYGREFSNHKIIIKEVSSHALESFGRLAKVSRLKFAYAYQFINKTSIYDMLTDSLLTFANPALPTRVETEVKRGIIVPKGDMIRNLMAGAGNIYTLGGKHFEGMLQPFFAVDLKGQLKYKVEWENRYSVADIYGRIFYGYDPQLKKLFKVKIPIIDD